MKVEPSSWANTLLKITRMREKTTSEVHIVVALFCRVTFRSFCLRLVERSAVNRNVVGSSPTRGAKKACKRCLQVFLPHRKRCVALKYESCVSYRVKKPSGGSHCGGESCKAGFYFKKNEINTCQTP